MDIKLFQVSSFIFKNQSYLVHQNEVGLLIDPAWDFKLIDNFIVDAKIKLLGVMLTHSHYDHTNLADKFASKYGCPVYMSDVEIEHYHFRCKNLRKTHHLSSLDFGELNVLPILTPGHTEGGMCYLINNNLFTGDTFFIEGIGVCDKKGAYDLFNSVQFVKRNLGLTTKFWPGHSFGKEPGKNLKYLLKNNIYFAFKDRDKFIKFRTRKNQPSIFNFK